MLQIKEKEVGQEVMIKGKVIADELGDLDANMSGGGGCQGYQAKFCEGRNRDEEE